MCHMHFFFVWKFYIHIVIVLACVCVCIYLFSVVLLKPQFPRGSLPSGSIVLYLSNLIFFSYPVALVFVS